MLSFSIETLVYRLNKKIRDINTTERVILDCVLYYSYKLSCVKKEYFTDSLGFNTHPLLDYYILEANGYYDIVEHHLHMNESSVNYIVDLIDQFINMNESIKNLFIGSENLFSCEITNGIIFISKIEDILSLRYKLCKRNRYDKR